MRLRVALIGCGAMSRTWLEAAGKIDQLEIVGLGDLDAARARERAQQFRLDKAAIATGIDQLLAEAKPDVLFDVVVPAARHRVVTSALTAGCHVLSEKPMAETMGDARDLIARASVAKRLHAVVQNRRYLGAIRRIARAVRSGAIGPVTSVHADFFLAPHFGGFREGMEHVLLLDMAIHGFDAMRAMTGLGANHVYALEWNPSNSWYRYGSSAAAIFELVGGAIFTYRGSWCADGLGTSWECAWRLVGSKGTLTWDGHDDIRMEVAAAPRTGLFDASVSATIPPLDPSDKVGGHLGVMQDFIFAVRNGNEPETVGRDNIRSLAMALGAIESAKAGRRMAITV